jgi:hypothetical protein
MPAELCIEHRYPDALAFLQKHGSEALAVLHDLLAHSELRDGDLVVEATVRETAERLGFLSKDTVHRRLRRLIRAGVVRRVPGSSTPGARFVRRAYAIDLDNTGISLTATIDDEAIEARSNGSTTEQLHD